MENNLIFLDVETTGTEEKDRIVQVAYKYLKGESFVEYFKPEIPISIDAMSVCHITNEMVADKPAFQKVQPFFLSKRQVNPISAARSSVIDFLLLILCSLTQTSTSII